MDLHAIHRSKGPCLKQVAPLKAGNWIPRQEKNRHEMKADATIQSQGSARRVQKGEYLSEVEAIYPKSINFVTNRSTLHENLFKTQRTERFCRMHRGIRQNLWEPLWLLCVALCLTLFFSCKLPSDQNYHFLCQIPEPIIH